MKTLEKANEVMVVMMAVRLAVRNALAVAMFQRQSFQRSAASAMLCNDVGLLDLSDGRVERVKHKLRENGNDKRK